MALRFTDQDNVRDAARGQSTSFSPTQDRGRNRTRIDNLRNNSQFNKPNKPSMFQQGSNAIGNFNPIPGIAGFAMEGVKAIGRDRAMQKQNDAYFGNTMLKNRPQYKKAQMSLMTPKDKDFYDKYMNLADMAQDNNKAEEYRDIAKTAYNNMQTTGRMNYGLSNIDPENDYLNSAGLPSYSKDLFGEGYGRMDMEAFKNAMGMGEGILDAIPAAERHPDVLDNYANQTFMPNMADVNTDMSKNKAYNDLNQAEIDYLMGRKDSITDEEMNIPEPFDDSAREQGIMDQQYQSPIGPRDNPFLRPNMMDVSGRGINRGLFPYPGYDRELVGLEQQGRGELPNPNAENLLYDYDLINRDFDYNQSNKDRVDNYRLDQILGRMRPEEEEVEEVDIFSARDR